MFRFDELLVLTDGGVESIVRRGRGDLLGDLNEAVRISDGSFGGYVPMYSRLRLSASFM